MTLHEFILSFLQVCTLAVFLYYVNRNERKNAARYIKLRGWMSSNVEEGWEQVECLAAISCYIDFEAFDKHLDTMPDCNVGLMQEWV